MHYRVAKLMYRVSYPDQSKIVADDAPEVMTALGAFTCTVGPDKLVAAPADEYRDEDTAREALEPLLRAWEAKTELLDGYSLKFTFYDAAFEVVDPPPGTTAVLLGTGRMIAKAGRVIAQNVRRDVPLPAAEILRVGQLTEQLRRRYQSVRDDRELATGFGYYLYTSLEDHFGGIRPAAQTLNVSSKVLAKLRLISSTEDAKYGRKVGGHPGQLTEMDICWLKRTIRILVGRMLQHGSGVRDTHLLTLEDLKVS